MITLAQLLLLFIGFMSANPMIAGFCLVAILVLQALRPGRGRARG